MSKIIQEPATKDQISQIEAIYEKVLNSVFINMNLTKAGAQRILESKEFPKDAYQAIATTFRPFLIADQFSNEEVDSNLQCSLEYRKTYSKEFQVTKLKHLYPGLGKNPRIGVWMGDLPKGSEDLFYVINIWKPWSSCSDLYHVYLEWLLNNLGRRFNNRCSTTIGPGYLIQDKHSKSSLEKLSEEQGHPDILVFVAQFGAMHRGRSIRRVQTIVIDQKQFCLGIFAIASMLITHPNRLRRGRDLHIDCASDVFRYSRGQYYYPYFKFNEKDGRLELNKRESNIALENHGTPSGFLSQ